MRNLSETEIKEILRHREQKIANVHKKMISLYHELADTEGLMESASFPVPEFMGMPGGKGGHKDLGDVLLQYHRQIYNRNEEIRKIMWELSEEEESISRVWACFHALGEPYYDILYGLYVENRLYQAVEDEFPGAHKTFERYRRQGIEYLLQLYHSGESIAELMRRQVTGREITSKRMGRKREEKEQGYEQISFSSILLETQGGKNAEQCITHGTSGSGTDNPDDQKK